MPLNLNVSFYMAKLEGKWNCIKFVVKKWAKMIIPANYFVPAKGNNLGCMAKFSLKFHIDYCR